METLPEVIGRSMVLATLLSKFLSHISLIVHPAPLMTNAPTPNTESIHTVDNSGAALMYPAIVIAHIDGDKRSKVPIGFSILINSM